MLEKGRQSNFMQSAQESNGVEMKGWELSEDQGEGLGREIKWTRDAEDTEAGWAEDWVLRKQRPWGQG